MKVSSKGRFFLFLPALPMILSLLASVNPRLAEANQPSAREFEIEVKKLESAYKTDQQNELLRGQLVSAYHQMSALLVKENNMNDALHYLEWADELERAGISTGQDSSDGYFAVAVAALAKGDLTYAEENFDHAIERKPNDEGLRKAIGAVFHNVGVEKLNMKQNKEAVPYLELSIKYYDKIQNTWELLGDLAYQMQDLRKAQKYWQTAASLGAALEIRRKLEKLEREAGVELNLAHYGATHFIIRYKRTDEAYQGYQLKQLLNDAYREVSQDFNFFPDLMIPVILYDEAEYEEVSNSPHWSAGVYDGKIRLPAYEEGRMNAKEVRRVIYHELTHAFVVDLAGNSCPVWLNEGLAEYQEDKVARINLSIFKDALANGKIFKIAQLDLGLSSLEAEVDVALFYQQSFLLTKFLIERYRLYRVREILEMLKAGQDFESALRKATGLSLETFEKKWLESLR